MNDHSTNEHDTAIVWADASLQSMRVEYQECAVCIREDVGVVKLVRCPGYVGFQMIGFWDETIIESAAVYCDHPFITECERRVNGLPGAGTKARIAVGNRLLEIVFIDHGKLWICGPQFVTEIVDEIASNRNIKNDLS